MFEIDNHTVAEYVHHFFSQNSGRKQIKREFAEIVHHGVPRVVSALITTYDVVIFRKQVHHSALAFVAPVDAANGSKHNFLLK